MTFCISFILRERWGGLALLLTVLSLLSSVSAQTKAALYDKAYQAMLEKALQPADWEQVNVQSDDQLKEYLVENIKEVNPDVASRRRKTEWRKSFLSKLYEELSAYADHLNRTWRKEYLDLVNQYNVSQIQLRSFQEAANRLDNAFKTYVSLQNSLLSIEEVYLQNLKGVSTTFLILGSREWNIESEPPNKPFNDIVTGGKAYIRRIANTHLIFSDTTVQDTRLHRDVIRDYSGGQIEEVETDPVLFTEETTKYAVQQYRVYPEFPSPHALRQEKVTFTSDEPSSSPGTRYLQLTNATLDDAFVPDKLQANIKILLDEAEEKNQQARQRIFEFEHQYTEDVRPIEQNIRETQLKINNEITSLVAQIQRLQRSPGIEKLEQQVQKFLALTKIDFIEKTPGEDDSDGRALKDEVITLLNRDFSSLFLDYKNRAERLLNAKTYKREMIVFTRHSEFLHGGERAQALSPKVLLQALANLESRKQRLVAYEFSVVEEGRLTNSQAERFYDAGKIIRYFMPKPVLSFQKSNEDGDTPRLSLLVALKIEYTKRGEPPPSAGVVPPPQVAFTGPQHGPEKPRFHDADKTARAPEPRPPVHKQPSLPNVYADLDYNAEWFLRHEAKCGTYPEMQQALPGGFTTPTVSQLERFKTFFESSDNRELQQKYSYLSSPQAELWSRKESQITRYRAAFRIADGEVAYHDPESFCGWIVGVRKSMYN